MNQLDVDKLLTKYKDGKCTPEETAFLEAWFLQWNAEKPFSLTDEALATDLDMISNQVFAKKSQGILNLWKPLAAASVIIIIATFGYFYAQKQPQNQVAQAKPLDIKPASSKAVLTLANGKQIILSDDAEGSIADQEGANVKKSKGQMLVYHAKLVPATAAKMEFNTISTPAGSRFHVILADGTAVWLNAMSSIKFPVAFVGKERKVEITGEAYFDVVHQEKMPFRVAVGKNIIEDIGTEFNVNAYKNEAQIKTTLVEGLVKIYSGSNNALIKPGQQAQVNQQQTNAAISISNDVDIESILGWKNNIFKFKNADINDVMRQLTRWYDVDVVYKDKHENKKFTGEISRTVNISQIFEMLHFFKIDCRLEQVGNRKQIVVTKV